MSWMMMMKCEQGISRGYHQFRNEESLKGMRDSITAVSGERSTDKGSRRGRMWGALKAIDNAIRWLLEQSQV